MGRKTKAELAMEDLLLVGQRMSNLCYNLGQRPGTVVDMRGASSMRQLARDWDEAVRRVKPTRKTKER